MFVCFVHCVPGTCVQLLLLGITCAPSRLVYCCTGLEGDQVYTPESVHPPESGANLHCSGQPPTTRHASQGCAQPTQQQNNAKINISSHFIANKYLGKNFSGHFTENKIPTLLLSSLVGTGFCCWPISSLPALKEEEKRRRRIGGGGVRGGGEV